MAETRSVTPDWLAELLVAVDLKARPPKWIAADSLPRLVIRGEAISPPEVLAILHGLQMLEEKKDEKEAVVPAVVPGLRADAEAISLDAFIHTLHERYHEAGRPPTGRWVRHAVRFLGGDRCALRVGAQVRQWAEALNRLWANYGIEILEGIGTETAIMQLDVIARKVRRESVRVRAQEAVEKIAAALGWTLEQLADRVVPDGGLDAQGTHCFDFGPRQFWFVAGPGLKPQVRDADGQVRAELPAPRQSDDPAKAAAAVAQWKLLKKTLRDTLKMQGDRLEQAMLLGRRWSAADFQQLFLAHPLMRHLARLLLWAEYGSDEQLLRSFRVAEDLTLFDADDEPLKSVVSQSVGIVHPLFLSEGERSKWGQICSDYSLLAPFPQIDRGIYRLGAQELKSRELNRHRGTRVHPMSLLSKMTRLGWENSGMSGTVIEHRRFFPIEKVTAVLPNSTGVPLGCVWEETQILDDCFFVASEEELNPWGFETVNPKEAMRLSDVPPLVVSETLRDLALLTATAN